ncbi:adenylosuccinate lyase [Carboxydocella sporoproducens DSM 16521]|uniref:Adenylosuccinate lyase n=2 Tax=Carboxydocella TaxID=178898 RepID=A0A1T4QBG7_9FIRM|nr:MULTISPECIES: adenylosuccinate lyase [Carboxydocella]AVX19358.1 adenylosuccinate lyase [Carboxydocella thermautotrophica]AVX29772.1 adenylosuccinate lyase [Carboxydocella thermautotrophica]SKA00568.1 adenylosuccinate lyase [Carboxydocella sporoproducens DSM 16521]
MIERYTLPEMGRIWSEENKYRKWLQVEIAACEAMAELGMIPADAVAEIKAKADFSVERILEIEQVTNHDVIAFLTCVAERVGEASRFIHLGMTSSDVLDTALALQMKEAGEILLGQLRELYQILLEKAQEYRYTPMIGRTHGIHAEPITFGLKMLLWAAETERNLTRLQAALEDISTGMISGAVGTYANIDPRVEEIACRKLGLRPAKVSTQIIQRDRHAAFMTTLAVIAGSLDKFATEIRNLQRTDILEVEEFFQKGQKGSSAMPHKRNPITCERIAGLARVVRANALAALENQALWHERDITHSSVERVIIPDSTIALNYMLHKFIGVMKNLLVYPENMLANINKTHGLVFSQRVLLALVDKGLTREAAYALVQRNALQAWETKQPFLDLVLADREITAHLNEEEIRGLFNFNYHLAQVDTIFARFGL